MSYIYKISNDINDLVYIGQTTCSINNRFKQHYYDRKEINNKFHKAINELGIEHFRIEIIEECSNEQLDERERYWINYYNSYKNGYNSKDGGQNSLIKTNPEQCIQYYLENKDNKTLTQITNELGVGTNNLRELLQEKGVRNKKTYYNFNEWTNEEKENIILDIKNGMSITKAEEKYHHDYRLIKKLLIDNNIPIPTGGKANKIPILQLDKDTNEIIKEWESIFAAKTYYNNKHIGECVNGQRKTAAGYKWIKKLNIDPIK